MIFLRIAWSLGGLLNVASRFSISGSVAGLLRIKKCVVLASEHAIVYIRAVAAGDLRTTLETAGKPLGPYDRLIAADALRTGATLVTANVSEFARVRGLVCQDWTAKA
jgi:predicted nucleic acid-binding protein